MIAVFITNHTVHATRGKHRCFNYIWHFHIVLILLNSCLSMCLTKGLILSSFSYSIPKKSSMDSQIPNVIYKLPQKTGLKNALFRADFCPFFVPKPLYIVVELSYLSFKPLFVIRIILLTCVV